MDVFLPGLFIFIFSQIIILAQIFLNQGLWRQSLLIDPFQKRAYEMAIKENIAQKNKLQGLYLLHKYDKLFGQCFDVTLKEIYYYEAFGEKDETAMLYQREILSRPFTDISIIKRTRDLYIGLYGNIKGKEKMKEILKQIINNYSKDDKNSDLYKQINSFCLKADLGC
jgi:hypothetical protein